jgi:hypothetical protein
MYGCPPGIRLGEFQSNPKPYENPEIPVSREQCFLNQMSMPPKMTNTETSPHTHWFPYITSINITFPGWAQPLYLEPLNPAPFPALESNKQS